MDRKSQINFYVPDSVKDAWTEFAKPYGARKGSLLGMAALAAFASLSDAEQAKWIGRAAQADAMNDFATMVELIAGKPSKSRK